MQSWTSLSVPKYRVEVASKVKIWDTEAQSIAEVSEKDIKLYVCGITPYDATHMGHAATYLTFDLLQRLLIIQIFGRRDHLKEQIIMAQQQLQQQFKTQN
jgi:L-cysteine:1D-myo-inositol 2-amino-2-deoxy-alpha-D-glucopyranoside ligase